MIVEKNFLNKLKEFGLNSYESKLWTALLSRGSSTAGELSDIATVPRSRTYDVLESLEKKGFIVVKQEKPIRYVAVPPEKVIDRVKVRIEKESLERMSLISQLMQSPMLETLNELHDKGLKLLNPTDISGILKEQGAIQHHLASRFKAAKKSISIMTSDEGLVRKAKALHALGNALKGVSVRVAAPLGKGVGKLASELSSIAAVKEARLSARFCVIDGREATIMLLDDSAVHPSYDTAVWVNSPYFAQSLERLFDSEWKRL
ncbi:TPA: TrmB family transcriptional regulator [Candidatus Woesearchaeota archaeon]|nr:TrmB family transcriptional regulator [Candidatus Woesearchaeota archaeon]HII68720.1 TrmB family transcriptional regulator [Candidatus Woesearchaeota archaeon]